MFFRVLFSKKRKTTGVYILYAHLLEVKNKEGRRLIHVPSWEWSRTVFAAGTTIHYYHEADVDINTIRIPGPTTEKLTVVVSDAA